MPSRAVTSFLQYVKPYLAPDTVGSVNALSGCYLISTENTQSSRLVSRLCQCPLGLLPHFYWQKDMRHITITLHVSMPSRAVTSFLQTAIERGYSYRGTDRVNALSGCYLISTETVHSTF